MKRTNLSAKLAYLRGLGVAEVRHDSHVPFLAHLMGTRKLLEGWGAREALLDAALFHSVYGTEFFDAELGERVSRDEVRGLIGDEAERLAWLWCNMRRDTLEPEARSVALRDGAGVVALSDAEAADLVELWSADTVEQAPRRPAEDWPRRGAVRRLEGFASGAARAALAAMFTAGT